jgi:hypothetical protein
MSAATAETHGRVFISYRRDDTAYPASWLYERLVSHLGRDNIFKDVDSIEPGDDFVEVINTAAGSCDVLLAMIGDRWLTITDQIGQRRLDNRSDFVRLEIEAALTRNVRVIPVLVGGARMPHADELPASMAKLARRHALELSPVHFTAETARLLKILDKTLQEAHTQAPSPSRQTSESAQVSAPVAAASRLPSGRGTGQDNAEGQLQDGAATPAASSVTSLALDTPAPWPHPVPIGLRRRLHKVSLASCVVLLIGAWIGINNAQPRSALSATMGLIIGLSAVGALLSLGILIGTRHRGRD